MSDAFVSPRFPFTVEHDGVAFECVSMSAGERALVGRAAERGADGEVTAIGVEGLSHAVRFGLKSWKSINGSVVPEFSANMDRNLERLSDDAYLEVAKKVIEVSFMTEEDRRNLTLPQQS